MERLNRCAKIYIKIKLLLFVVITFSLACDGDNYQELSGNYILRDEGANNKSILSHEKGRPDIYSKIVSYDYNSDFILAIQEPVYEDYVFMIGYELRISNLKKYPTNSTKERIQSEAEADSILKHNPYYKSIFVHKINYWIISHKSKKLYGPLTKAEYKKMRIELGVPDGLGLEEE